jgi:hypothetical protein
LDKDWLPNGGIQGLGEEGFRRKGGHPEGKVVVASEGGLSRGVPTVGVVVADGAAAVQASMSSEGLEGASST